VAQAPYPRQLGYRIVSLDGQTRTPRGIPPNRVHSFNTALTFVLNACNRHRWGLVPALEGDLENPEVVHMTAPEALKLVQAYNRLGSPLPEG
jgi:hypothetical protein